MADEGYARDGGRPPAVQVGTWVLAIAGLAGLLAAWWIAAANAIPDAAAPPTGAVTPSPAPTATATPSPAPTPSYATATAGKSWDAFYKDAIEPLAGATAFFVAGVLGFLVLARLLVELPFVRKRTSSRADRTVLSIIAWTLVVVAPLLLCVAGIQMDQERLAPNMVLLGILIAVGIVGALALAQRMASGLKLELAVTGAGLDQKDANLARADVVTALQSLAEPARWVELPSGVDLADLAKSLGSLSKSPIVEGLRSVVLFVLGVTPWRITVTQIDAADATVEIARNGRTSREVRVSLAGAPYDKLAFVAPLLEAPQKDAAATTAAAAATALAKLKMGKPQPPVAPAAPALPRSRDLLATTIAALIVSEIAGVEVRDFATALVGATDPTSIALHSMATTWYLKDGRKAEAAKVLELATQLDPYNRHAQWTLDWAQSRDRVEPEELLAFMSRLRARLDDRASELRRGFARDVAYSSTLLTLGAVTRNYAAVTAPDGNGTRERLIQQTRDALDAWVHARPPADAGSRIARERAQLDLAALDVALGKRVEAAGFMRSESIAVHPVLAYSLACYLVRWEGRMFRDTTVVARLTTAMTDAALFEFAAKDPELNSTDDGDGFAWWLESRGPRDDG